MHDKKIATVEINEEKNTVYIHGNPIGLKYLAGQLLDMSKTTENHAHLTTESWGGEELSEVKFGVNDELINQLVIYCWDC